MEGAPMSPKGSGAADALPWKPNIIAFCCNWCAYAGADLAGVNRRQITPEVRVLRVMCSGRVSPGMMLRSFTSGADGVMVLGCHPGDCHYRVGNVFAEKRVAEVRELLDLAGVDPSRLLLRWISASEGDLFAKTMDEFVDHIRELGPLGGAGYSP
jgi:F420-non-reducing hydrogenase iron-sulfur subunit